MECFQLVTRRKKPIVKDPRNLFDVYLITFYIERLELLWVLLANLMEALNYKGSQSGNHKPNSRIVLKNLFLVKSSLSLKNA